MQGLFVLTHLNIFYMQIMQIKFFISKICEKQMTWIKMINLKKGWQSCDPTHRIQYNITQELAMWDIYPAAVY